MEVLLLDNHDSFTYNIAHIVREIDGVNLQIITAGMADPAKLGGYDGIIFSPGPDIPLKNNQMEQILSIWESKIPILGICLGLQAIVLYYGGELQQLPEVVHGRTRNIMIKDKRSPVFRGLPDSIEVGLYHSWIADREKLPACLEITALSKEGRIMAVRHREHPVEAVQFHPESIMTPSGPSMLRSWLAGCREFRSGRKQNN